MQKLYNSYEKKNAENISKILEGFFLLMNNEDAKLFGPTFWKGTKNILLPYSMFFSENKPARRGCRVHFTLSTKTSTYLRSSRSSS